MKCLCVALVALAASAFSPATPPQKHGPAVRIYVWTTRSEAATPPEEEQGLLDSVRDLSTALSRSQFTLVSSADEAQVTVEVFDREERDSAQGGFGGATLTKFRETIVRVRVKAGDDESELKGIGRPSWNAAAKDVADQLSRWVKNHHIPAAPLQKQ
jgi:hypothetical protein